jgi:hypothetical protein
MSLFVGLDLHKKYTEYAVMDVGGKLEARRDREHAG